MPCANIWKQDKEPNVKKKFIYLTVLAILLCANLSALWQGDARIGSSAEFPAIGFFARSDLFPPYSLIEIRNPKTNRHVRAVVIGTSQMPGMLVSVSNEVANELGMFGYHPMHVEIVIPSPVSEVAPDSLSIEESRQKITPRKALGQGYLPPVFPQYTPMALPRYPLPLKQPNAPYPLNQNLSPRTLGLVPRRQATAPYYGTRPQPRPRMQAQVQPMGTTQDLLSKQQPPAPIVHRTPSYVAAPQKQNKAEVYEQIAAVQLAPEAEKEPEKNITAEKPVAPVNLAPSVETHNDALAQNSAEDFSNEAPVQNAPVPQTEPDKAMTVVEAVPEIESVTKPKEKDPVEEETPITIEEISPVIKEDETISVEEVEAIEEDIEEPELEALDEVEEVLPIEEETTVEESSEVEELDEINKEESTEELETVEEDSDITEEVELVDVTESDADIEEKTVATLTPSEARRPPKDLPYSKTGTYFVQIATYSDDLYIQNIKSTYGDRYPVTVSESTDPSEKTFRVFIGPINRDEVGAVLESFRKAGFSDAIISAEKK